MANSTTLLIDDCEENLDKFVKAGGRVCTYPAPWNHMREYQNEQLETVHRAIQLLLGYDYELEASDHPTLWS